MDGVTLTSLKKISHPNGDIFHAMKVSDKNFFGFGEAYFTSVKQDKIKGWKKHSEMILNLIVVAGKIQFELGNASRIRVPKDGNTTVSVRVDVKDINSVTQSGQVLAIALDTNAGDDGVEAVTAATGSDLQATDITPTGVTSQSFVILNTQMTLRHATTQPAFADPSAASQEFYRFTVTADAANSIELERVTLDLALQGMTYLVGTPTYVVRQVKADGTLDTTSVITDSVAGTGAKLATDTTDKVVVDFANETVAAGSSRTYALLFNNTQDEGTANDDDSVSVTILTDAGQVGPELKGAAALVGQNIVWADESANGTDGDYFNGYLIDQDTTAQVNQD